MIDRLHGLFDTAVNAVGLVVEEVVAVNPWWIAAAVALHIASQAARNVGWFNIIRTAYPDAHELRRRDVIAAYFAGAGLNAFVPARGGDLVKLFLVHKRVRGGRYSTLIATFVPETLFETLCGTALVIWALALGFFPVPATAHELGDLDVSFVMRNPLQAAAIAAGIALAGWLAVRWLRRGGRRFWERMKDGVSILRSPRDYVTGVVTWQALGRVIRLGSLACFMAAFGLPATLATALLVMASQGGGKIIPIAPAAAGLRLAMLSYGFVEITGQPVDIAAITAFAVGTGIVLAAVGIVLSVAILAHELDTLSPRAAMRNARAAIERARGRPPPAETPAS